MRTERRLADASELLGNRAKLTPSRQAELLERLSATLEARDPYTHGHSRRVTRHSEAIARRMGLTRVQVAKVRTAAAVHDVGKIKTPRDVLNKPGMLSDEEFAAIKLHPVDGAELVAGLGDPELTAMVRHHHERLDRGGYPDGLGGADIPLGARIIAVADTFDAITSTRPYRTGAKHKVALDILRKEAGPQLDPAAVAAFLSYYSGRSSVAWWSLLVAEPPRFLSWVLGWFQGAGATPLAKGVLAAGATALIGGTLASPPAPKAEIRSNSVATAVAQGRAGSGGTAAAATPPPSPRSRDRADRRTPPPSRRRHRTPDRPLEPSGSRGPGSRSGSDDARSEVGTGGGSGSAGPRDGGTNDSSSGGGSGGGGSGGGGSGDGSGTGSDGKPLPSIDAPELPPLPADVPIPTIQPPELPPCRKRFPR